MLRNPGELRGMVEVLKDPGSGVVGAVVDESRIWDWLVVS